MTDHPHSYALGAFQVATRSAIFALRRLPPQEDAGHDYLLKTAIEHLEAAEERAASLGIVL